MSDGRMIIGRGRALLAAVVLVMVTAGVTYLAVRPRAVDEQAAGQAPSSASPAPTADASTAAAARAPIAAAPDTPLPDVQVNLTEEAVARAGIEVRPVGTSSAGGAVTIPAVIEANAYGRVQVTPLVGGRVTRVDAELGQPVRRGATLALVYSPGLAEAQTRFLSTRAELEATTQELKRTERLVAIGAASQQELERIRASHTSVATAVEGARAQLVLLGMTPTAITKLTAPSEITATTSVAAPISGTVIERQANPGLNVDPSMPLFTIVDLSNVWAIGDVYERDFPHVRVGSQATITTAAYPGLTLAGRITYIDPQLNPATRTARVRVEVPNPRGELRLGMYAELQIASGAGSQVLTVPRDAVQTIGDRQFVYIAAAGSRGRFIEREVRLGNASGENVEVTTGVAPGDTVVTTGSFYVRAERERLGLRPITAAGAPSSGIRMGESAPTGDAIQVTVTEKGFEPARVTASAAEAVRVAFVRTTENTCAKEIIVPSLNIRRALRLNEPVVIELPRKAGEVAFTCGMNMLRGAVVVQ
jgi:RND family efflux transporter MFP subunit